MQYSYNLRPPVSQKARYNNGDNVDFSLSFAGQGLVGNSVRISGILQVNRVDTTPVTSADSIFYDAFCGAHAFFNNVVVKSALKGILENQSDCNWVSTMHANTFNANLPVFTGAGGTLLTMIDTPALANPAITYSNPNIVQMY